MAWIELHQSLPTHHRTMTFMDALDIDVPCAVGHLACLWLWCLDNAPDGALTFSARTVARAAQWSGDPDAFVSALEAAGFLENGALHDWQDYAGKLIDQRRANAEKQRQWRERHKTATSPPYIEARNRHVTVTSPSRTAATVPNPTVPNQYTPNGVAPDKPAAEPAKVRAAPKPAKDKTPAHPAFKAVEEILHFRPDQTQRAAILKAVGDDQDALDLFVRCCEQWRLAGHNVRNLSGILDWVSEGGPPPAAPRERANGHVAVRAKPAARNEPPPLPGPVVPASPEARAEYDAIRSGKRVKPVSGDPAEFERKRAEVLAQARARIGVMPT